MRGHSRIATSTRSSSNAITAISDTKKQLEAAGGNAREHGFALAGKLLDWARGARSSGIAGAYLIPPFKRYEEILDLF